MHPRHHCSPGPTLVNRGSLEAQTSEDFLRRLAAQPPRALGLRTLSESVLLPATCSDSTL